MEYRQSGQKLGTYLARARDGLYMYHEGGGVYQVLMDSKVLRTKHVREAQ